MSASQICGKQRAVAVPAPVSAAKAVEIRLNGVKTRFMARIARGLDPASGPPHRGHVRPEPATADRPAPATSETRLSDQVVKARVQP